MRGLPPCHSVTHGLDIGTDSALVLLLMRPTAADDAAGGCEPLFAPFRALGYITDDVPFAIQRRGKETFVTVSVGRTWQLYNGAKLSLVGVGPQLDREVCALATKGDLTFAAAGNTIQECRRFQRCGGILADWICFCSCASYHCGRPVHIWAVLHRACFLEVWMGGPPWWGFGC